MIYNGFATTDIRKDKLSTFRIPDKWWSRKFEYPWAAQFVDKNDVVLDAGCGIKFDGKPHFFKFYLAENSKKVIGVDLDPNVTKVQHNYDNLELKQGSLDNLEFEDNTFDKIFCISVIEHFKEVDILKVLNEFARVLKPNGKVIVTLDTPKINVKRWVNLVNESDLEFLGDVDIEEPENILTKIKGGTLKIFHSVLVTGGNQ